MGLLDRAKDVFSGSDSGGSEDLAAEFNDEIMVEEDASMEDDFGNSEDIDEEVEQEWETAYQFCFDMIEEDGYATMSEFIGKYMYYEVSKSERYRDRLQHGAETVELVSSSVEALREARGESSNTDFEELADKLQAADRAINAADSLSGKDEMMTQDLINLGYEAIDTVGSSLENRSAGSVESTVTESNEEM